MKFKSMRITAFLLAVVMMLTMFVGCGDEAPKNNLGNIPGNYDMIVDSADKINCDYLLIYHSTASYAEIDSFIDFLEALSIASTASFQICPDTVQPKKADQKIILLGNTNYKESTNSSGIITSIRANNYYDYLIRSYDNVVSVNWMSKFGRQDAFDYILNTLLPKGLKGVFNKEYSFLYLSERSDAPIVTINDVNIVQYAVVVPNSCSYTERLAAERLVRVIKDATGVDVPLVTDAVDESEYEILIGDTNRGETAVTTFFATNRYAVAQYSSKLILRGGQIDATSAAVYKFTNMVETASITAEPLHIKPNYSKTGSTDNFGGELFNGYNLVFSDEFNATALNKEKWTTEDGAIVSYGIGGALMFFNSKNAKLDGKNLTITTHLGNEGYVSGHLTTEDSFSFKYGYVEIRARFRATPGMWIKMLLTDQNDKKETISQIDVFNSLGSQDTVFGSAGVLDAHDYYQNYLKLNEPTYEAFRSGALDNEKLFKDDEYHTYGVEWTENYIRFFVDGISYGTVEVAAGKYDGLKTEMYLDLIAGVNLTEQTADDEIALWPLDWCIDWVRVYQKPGSAFTDRTVVVEEPTEKPQEPAKDKDKNKK